MDYDRCTNCHTPRPGTSEPGRPRTPCPVCGATAITQFAEASDSMNMEDGAQSVLTPRGQTGDWRERWRELERLWAKVSEIRTGECSGSEVRDLVSSLWSVLLLSNHLRDSLSVTSEVKKHQINDALRRDQRLAVMADVANIIKHVKPSDKHPPWTGHQPQVGRGHGVDVPGGWTIRLEIEHDAKVLDGMDVARDAIEAWREKLAGWGLI